ncbi:histidine kinase [Malaciobacter mytili LMG 24559]|uniref:histidine kinase n=1 Tax=Malaciobacter mytili LMG 24559 TaxID=1032238 RepID=A0AAX2AHQ6_9BACT|nr:cache domain-containing protein [Malaciobacter mytili]AXH16071.1 Cache sensor-containing two-component system histidine kinase [Malaciobacter mytili LMG 24559]RXK14986.1 histidine kinase [Malaciobacter mytili LMG 24559]
MNYKNEKNLTRIIRYSLPLLTIIISLVITILLFLENKRTFEQEKKLLNSEFIKENKKNIQEEVERVYNYILYMKESTDNSLKNQIKNRVYEAYQIANDIYEKYKNKKSKEEIFEIIKDTLRSITFNEGRGYYFIDDINGIKHLQPLNPEFEGKNLLNYKDANGYEFVKTISETIKNKSERFDTYYWYKPNDLKSYRKISFYKYFEPYNIVIGTGEYVEDYENEVKRKVLNYINLIRYKNEGYIFILDYDFNYLSHINPKYIGKNALLIDDAKNIENVSKDILFIAKNGEGYYSYIQYRKPSTNLPTKKISYVKGIKNWNWIIGTGFYEDDLKNNLEQKKKEIDTKFLNYISNVLVVAFVLTLIFLAISIYISKLIEDNFRIYKKEIENQQNILAQQSKMASMGEMIANIAHQWRQPLSVISTAATGISFQKELNSLSDKDFFEATEKINDSAQYLSKTIDDFKNFFSPIKNEKLTNIKELFLKTFKLLDAQFKTKNINIVQNIKDIQIVTLENEFLQVLINILNNARDELVKVEYDRFIFINVSHNEKTAIIEIYDNAGGINEKYLEKVFEPYFTTKDKSIGTGIGLYMSHEIVTKHLNGTLSVQNYEFTYKNKNYKGAKFTIEIFI